MQGPSTGKYRLIDVHKEIDLYDRKIAYCRQQETFGTEEKRAGALVKLQRKRTSLVKTAQDLMRKGVQCDSRYLPRSLRAAE